MSFSFFIYDVTNPLQYPPLTSRDLVHSNKRLLSHGFCYHDVTLDDFFLLESGGATRHNRGCLDIWSRAPTLRNEF